jgi:hypothetical protein
MGHDCIWLAAPSLEQSTTASGRMPIVPCCLDKKPTDVDVPGLGDRASPSNATTGVLGRYKSNEGHQLRRMRESGEVADLRRDRESRESVDPSQTSQLADQISMSTAIGSVGHVMVHRSKPIKSRFQSSEVLVEDRAREDIVETLRTKPGPMCSGPMLAVAIRAPLTKEKL